MTKEQIKERRKQRNLLVFLYVYFEGKQSLILDEIISHKLLNNGETTPEKVEQFIKDNNIDVTDYITILDNVYFAKKYKKDITAPVMIYKKKGR